MSSGHADSRKSGVRIRSRLLTKLLPNSTKTSKAEPQTSATCSENSQFSSSASDYHLLTSAPVATESNIKFPACHSRDSASHFRFPTSATLSKVKVKTYKFIRRVKRSQSTPLITLPEAVSQPLSQNDPSNVFLNFSSPIKSHESSKKRPRFLNGLKKLTIDGNPTSTKDHSSFKLLKKKFFDMKKNLISNVQNKNVPQKDNASSSNSNHFSLASAKSELPENLDLLLPPSSKQEYQNFRVVKLLGRGTFGKVVLALHENSQEFYAIKIISKSIVKNSPTESQAVWNERNVLRVNIDHPFLVGLHCSFQSPTHLYLVMDYVSGGELFYHLQKERRFSEARVVFYSAEITSALAFLHSSGILYRDLKPENILIDSLGHIVLTDFGLAKLDMKPSSRTVTFCGTPEYLAPEIVRRQPYGLGVDWWCLGCMIYEMLIGIPPFYSPNPKELFQRILFDALKFPSIVSGPARGIICNLLVRAPHQRLSDAKIIKKHQFFHTIDWIKLEARKVDPPFVPGREALHNSINVDSKPSSASKKRRVSHVHAISNQRATSESESSQESVESIFKGFSFYADSDTESLEVK